MSCVGSRAGFHASRFLIGTGLALAFAWTLALSVSPQLHASVHSDAGQAEHTCAATMIASGNYEHPVPTPVFNGIAPAPRIEEVPAFEAVAVAPNFVAAGVLEHAPPVLS
jgi:hypothetical protein